jgi:cytochrome c-type biogenesis protein CcmH
MIAFWLIVAVMTAIAIGILLTPFLQQKRMTPTLFILVITLPALAMALYLKLGASQHLAEQQQRLQQDKAIEAEIERLGSLQNIISTLKQKVEANPDSRGWFLLGRLYLKAQQFKEAQAAFAKADHLARHQPEVLESKKRLD